MSRMRRRGRESSAGRLAHPPHSMRIVEACPAAAARGAAFVSPHCRPRITKVHCAAACPAPAQSPSATLIGYDITALFHHAAYAASYTARSAPWQATPLATPDAVPTRQRLVVLNGGFKEQARKSRREIPFACIAIVRYFILHQLGPPVGDSTAMYAPLLRYKRVALAVHTKLQRAHTDTHWTQLQAHPGSSNTAYSGRRVLRSGGPNHSKPAVFIVFLSEIELGLANPQVLTLWA